MEQERISIKQAIENLLKAPDGDCFGIVGNQDDEWFMISQLKLAYVFNRPMSPVMVRFGNGSRDPVILVPAILDMKPDTNMCPNFLRNDESGRAWKPLCPHMFQDVGDEMLVFIASLAGFMANPNLCGRMGCEGRALAQENEV
ncbi:hypothetical protein ACFL5Z_12915 [Planctomycetota bacterium]